MDVSERMRAGLVAEGAVRRFRVGDLLLRQGEPAGHVLLLVSGRVKVLLTLPNGESLLLAVRDEGELLGEIAVLGGDGRSATVVAATPCVTRVMPADRFRAFVRTAGLEGELLGRALRRLREGETWRAEIAVLPAGPRVVRALLRLAAPAPGGAWDVHLNQTEIGQAVGLSRGVVAAELAALRDRGLIVTTRSRIAIPDPGALRDLAASGHGSV